MRKLIFFLGGVVLLSFLSCSKTQNLRTKNSTALESFQNFEKRIDQRLAFNLLTVTEKAALAKEHIDFCISYFNLSTTQISILENVKSDLKDIYSSTDPENEPCLIQLALDIDQYFTNLSDLDGQLIFDSMVTNEEGVNEMIVYNPDKGGTGCTCSTKSSWCSSSPYGPRILCDKSACMNTTTWGCGTLWGYACNGKCNIFA